MARALECVEAVTRSLASGEAQNVPRSRVRLPGATLHVMSAGDSSLGFCGVKSYTTTRHGNQFVVLLFSMESGELVATIEASLLGQLRTGAASGVATKWLARNEARVLGVIGAGLQAETQIEAICAVRPIEEVLVFCRDGTRREEFASRMCDRLNARVIATASARECVDADIVVTVTSSREPVLCGDWLRTGTHLNAVGSNALTRRELDLETVKRCSRIVVDSREQSKLECGDLLPALEANLLCWQHVLELNDIVGGLHPGRTSPEEITLFESHGLAAWDLAMAVEVFRSASTG